MGVCGTGKSTIGHLLAQALGWTYADADDFHPPANVTKMRSGLPLNDEDRGPWLDRLNVLIARHQREDRGLVLACSALKVVYRQQLAHGLPAGTVRFVHLHGDRALLTARLGARTGHYMPARLLDSQLATLEEPTPAEAAIWCDVAHPPEAIVESVLRALG